MLDSLNPAGEKLPTRNRSWFSLYLVHVFCILMLVLQVLTKTKHIVDHELSINAVDAGDVARDLWTMLSLLTVISISFVFRFRWKVPAALIGFWIVPFLLIRPIFVEATGDAFSDLKYSYAWIGAAVGLVLGSIVDYYSNVP